MGNKKEMKRRRKSGPLKLYKIRQTVANNDVCWTQQVTVHEEEEILDVVLEENRDVPETLSASSRKIDMESDVDVNNVDIADEDNEVQHSHYIFMDSSILEMLISVIGICPDCQSKELKSYNDVSKKRGLSNCIVITCSECNFSYSTYSSKNVNKPNTPGKEPFDVNARCIIAFREIGKGFNAIEFFFGLMNCVPPMNEYFRLVLYHCKGEHAKCC